VTVAGAWVETAAPALISPDNTQTAAPLAMISAMMTDLFKLNLPIIELMIKNSEPYMENELLNSGFAYNFYSPVFKAQGLGSVQQCRFASWQEAEDDATGDRTSAGSEAVKCGAFGAALEKHCTKNSVQ
jgi:hypothetical protein